MQQRIALGKLRDSTWERYQQTLKEFAAFLAEQGVFELSLMNRTFIESYHNHSLNIFSRASRRG
jgi:hypothetical protein